ncbi:MAG: prefoldin subunit alpha [Candidatus Micrarchaeota archaeon]
MNEKKSVQPPAQREGELARMELDYRVLQQRAAEIQQQLQQLQALLAENDAASRALEAVSKNDELLLPVGSGVLARFRVADKDKVLAEVGGRVVAEKKVDEAQALLKEKQEKLSKTAESMQNELFAIGRSLQAIEEKASESRK